MELTRADVIRARDELLAERKRQCESPEYGYGKYIPLGLVSVGDIKKFMEFEDVVDDN